MRRLYLVVLVVIGGLGSGPHATAQIATRTDVTSVLEPMVTAHQKAAATHGISVAVVFPDGSVFQTASGEADAAGLEPLTPDHQLGFASITKTFVAATILQLVEDGKLSLDAPVRDIMTAPRNVNAGITVRQLLGHQSGLYNYTEHPNLQSRLRQDTSHVWTPSAMMAEFVGSPVFFAGTRAAYSNSNYVLLEMIAESVSTATLGEHMQHRLFEPLGLVNTFYGPEQRPDGPIPVTWSDLDGLGGLDDFSRFYASTSHLTGRSAAGGIISTPTDIAKWARAVFGGSVLQPASRDAFISFHDLEGQNAVWTGYGLGSQQYFISGVEFWGHSGLITGSASLMLYAPAYDVSIAMVDTDAMSQPFVLAARLAEWLSTTTFTGVEEIQPTPRAAQMVYPNPASAGDRVVLPLAEGSNGPVDVVLYDVLGRRLFTDSSDHHTGTERVIQLPHGLAPGLVVYAIHSSAGSVSGTLLVRE